MSISSKESLEKYLSKKSALIIVDMQNDFCHEKGACAICSGKSNPYVDIKVPNIQRMIDSCHELDVPVIFIKTTHQDETDSAAWIMREDGAKARICRRDSWGTEFYGVVPVDKDIIVNKIRYSAFIGTRLNTVLKTLEVKTIIMSGISTNVCVESTARDGFMMDYNVVMLDDACITYSEEAHKASLDNIRRHFGAVSDVDTVSGLIADLRLVLC